MYLPVLYSLIFSHRTSWWLACYIVPRVIARHHFHHVKPPLRLLPQALPVRSGDSIRHMPQAPDLRIFGVQHVAGISHLPEQPVDLGPEPFQGPPQIIVICFFADPALRLAACQATDYYGPLCRARRSLRWRSAFP
ncbi:hypothetical protein F5X99DRAFT_378572 [Biscogniauxia marginata]|nr:hypothetical protein F5X99DRAFT_378572 [Biscogniauxia marginata]